MRGMSLAEVLVVTGLLSLLGMLVAVIYSLGLSAQNQIEASTAAYRAGLAALEGLKRELRGARLVTPGLGEAGPEVRFRSPLREGEFIQVDALGAPLWSEEARLGQEGSELVRTDPAGQRRILTQLGPGGEVRFERREARSLVLQIVTYGVDRRTTSQSQLEYSLFLPNQP